MLAGALTVAVLIPLQASAAPDKVEQVRKEVTKLSDEAEMATEEYNKLVDQRSSIQVRQKATISRMAQQRKNVAAAKAVLAKTAIEEFKTGRLGVMELVVSGDSGDALLAQQLGDNITERRTNAQRKLIAEEAKLKASQTAYKNQLTELAKSVAEQKKLKDTIENKLKASQVVLRRLDVKEQQRVINAIKKSNGSTRECSTKIFDAPNAKAAAVIDFACEQIGDWYQWGGNGMKVFDCSGLTQQAYKRANISIPRVASDQQHSGRRVSADQARAGDLVFFGSPAHHVGIYLGEYGGKKFMLHAPRSGEQVKIVDLGNEYKRTPSGYTRYIN